jgi:hypothetical protein
MIRIHFLVKNYVIDWYNDFVVITGCCKVIEPRHAHNPAQGLGYGLNELI